MEKIIGIDLGTTNSVLAIMEQGKPIIIPNSEGERLTPSVVAWDPNSHQMRVGSPARRQAVINPQHTVFSIKRYLGQRFDSPFIQPVLEFTPYKTQISDNGGVSVRLADGWCSPQEILSTILKKLKRDAEAYLGEQVKKVVITVPSYYNFSQRQSVKDACYAAGLEALRIINESTAACLAYGFDKQANEIIAVFHLGGGTFDISILEIGEGVFQVRSTCGDTHLGGDDWDRCITNFIAGEFQKSYGVDLRKDPQALQRLKEACEKAKIELSTVMETMIDLPFITRNGGGEYLNLQMSLTQAKLEELTLNLINRTLITCKQAVKDAGLSLHDINRVILAGQPTRMPAVQRAVKEFFGKYPCRGVDPAEVVALGAAIQAGVLGGELEDIVLLDVTPLTLSVETLGGVATPLIYRNTTIPYRESQVFSTASDSQTRVEIHVLQGEGSMAADNMSLGKFILEGIPPVPKGIPQFEVTFELDSSNILEVSAKDKATGLAHSVTLTYDAGNLSPAHPPIPIEVPKLKPGFTPVESANHPLQPPIPPKQKKRKDSAPPLEETSPGKKWWQFRKK
jgi:molecular chaperone DnaK